MFAFAMDPSNPRPPTPPIPISTTMPTGTASGSRAPAASLVTASTAEVISDKPGAGGTGQGLRHFMNTILSSFSSGKLRDHYLNGFGTKRDTIENNLGTGIPATCFVDDLRHKDPRSHTHVQPVLCRKTLALA